MSVERPADTEPKRPVYLDGAATTQVDPRVADEVLHYMTLEFGNAGSRTHSYGQVAKARVSLARSEVAQVVDASPDEVIFTSGATESNNLALLGLEKYARGTGRMHIVSTAIEHKAVLEPLEELERRGFEVDLVPPTAGGWVEPGAVAKAVRSDTALVSVMAVNNETGVRQPLDEIARMLADHEAFLHADAAQAFGKSIDLLRNPRIDLTSISGHKIGAPKGIGALVMRRRGYSRPPLQPLTFGGGQERGLRPGTLPVALIAGLGTASRLAFEEHRDRETRTAELKNAVLGALEPLGAVLNGDPERTITTTLNFSVPGVDSEAAIVALKDVAAISNGSACTSQSYEPSHVLTAAGLSMSQVDGALRLSWSHDLDPSAFVEITQRLKQLQG